MDRIKEGGKPKKREEAPFFLIFFTRNN